MRMFNVRIDDAVEEAIDRLAAALGPEIPAGQGRSVAVRRAILDAAKRLAARGGKS